MTADSDSKKLPQTRRDFLYLSASAMGAVGCGAVAWPFINSMNPAADTLALSSIDVDLQAIPEATTRTVMWRGRPLFIRHRTTNEIQSATTTPLKELLDPQTDAERCPRPQWLVVIGVCTHLGCIPNKREGMAPLPGTQNNETGGWHCPCHGSVYDISGRVRVGPAPRNLEVPPYQFVNDTTLRVG
ncbi:MAG: ubiquinol-cytochrome c reductase iron-sulfur subunit [Alphaproteobacteria bacterium]